MYSIGENGLVTFVSYRENLRASAPRYVPRGQAREIATPMLKQQFQERDHDEPYQRRGGIVDDIIARTDAFEVTPSTSVLTRRLVLEKLNRKKREAEELIRLEKSALKDAYKKINNLTTENNTLLGQLKLLSPANDSKKIAEIMITIMENNQGIPAFQVLENNPDLQDVMIDFEKSRAVFIYGKRFITVTELREEAGYIIKMISNGSPFRHEEGRDGNLIDYKDGLFSMARADAKRVIDTEYNIALSLTGALIPVSDITPLNATDDVLALVKIRPSGGDAKEQEQEQEE